MEGAPAAPLRAGSAVSPLACLVARLRKDGKRKAVIAIGENRIYMVICRYRSYLMIYLVILYYIQYV